MLLTCFNLFWAYFIYFNIEMSNLLILWCPKMPFFIIYYASHSFVCHIAQVVCGLSTRLCCLAFQQTL